MTTSGDLGMRGRGSLGKSQLLLGVAVVALGGVLVNAHFERKRSAAAEVAMRAELARLGAEVQAVKGSSGKLSAAVQAAPAALFASTSPQRAPLERSAAETGAGKDAQKVDDDSVDPNDFEARQRFAAEQASERVGQRFDAYIASEAIDPAWAPETMRSIGTTLAALPTQKLVASECRARICRVVIESDSAEEQHEIPKQVAGNGPFKADVFYRYDYESTPPKTTLYVARLGTPLGSLIRGK